jgi:hypothetical protein
MLTAVSAQMHVLTMSDYTDTSRKVESVRSTRPKFLTGHVYGADPNRSIRGIATEPTLLSVFGRDWCSSDVAIRVART